MTALGEAWDHRLLRRIQGRFQGSQEELEIYLRFMIKIWFDNFFILLKTPTKKIKKQKKMLLE